MNVIETLKQAEATLEGLRRKHYWNSDDGWWNCPKSEHGSREGAGNDCDCGADKANAKIDEMIEAIRRQIMFLEMDLSI